MLTPALGVLAVDVPAMHVHLIYVTLVMPVLWLMLIVGNPEGCIVGSWDLDATEVHMCNLMLHSSRCTHFSSFCRADCISVCELQGKLPDYSDPVVLPKNRRTVEDFCNRIHKGIMKQFKYALVWGTSVKHKPQKVGRDHVLDDEDIVQIVKKI